MAKTAFSDSLASCIPGGQILATDAIRTAYQDGKGSIPMRGKAIIEGDPAGPSGNGATGTHGPNGTEKIKSNKPSRKRRTEVKPAVVITELPYQTNKVRLVHAFC